MYSGVQKAEQSQPFGPDCTWRSPLSSIRFDHFGIKVNPLSKTSFSDQQSANKEHEFMTLENCLIVRAIAKEYYWIPTSRPQG